MKRPSATRSKTMRAVKSKDTGPELLVRRLAHSLGYRYRLHRKDLPGKPDMVFPGRRKVIFVHGCFWHRHDCKRGSRTPKTNADYWLSKLSKNRERDQKNVELLQSSGWDVLIVWECELKNPDALKEKICSFLGH